MKRPFRLAAVLASIAAGVVVAWYAGLFYGYHHAETSRQALGGHWYLERSYNPLWERSPLPRLVRKMDSEWERVDSWVTEAAYLGDDCVLYSRSQRGQEWSFAVCDGRPPVFIADDADGPVSVGSDGLVRYELTGNGKRIVEVISGTSAKAKAQAVVAPVVPPGTDTRPVP